MNLLILINNYIYIKNKVALYLQYPNNLNQ